MIKLQLKSSYNSTKGIHNRLQGGLTCAGVEDGGGCRVSVEKRVEADDVLCVGLKGLQGDRSGVCRQRPLQQLSSGLTCSSKKHIKDSVRSEVGDAE